MLTPKELAEIRERAEKASPGPWATSDDMTWDTTVRGPSMTIYDEGGHTREDADFIAHSRQDIPALLAHIEQLEGEIKKLREYTGDDYQCHACFESFPNVSEWKNHPCLDGKP